MGRHITGSLNRTIKVETGGSILSFLGFVTLLVIVFYTLAIFVASDCVE